MIQSSQQILRGNSIVYHSRRDAKFDKCNDRNNNFHFAAETNFQKICPFAAHVRKTNPRADLEGLVPPQSIESRRIMRRGVQFGPEVTNEERKAGKTLHNRGLLFTCYQSSINDGFAFIQESTLPHLPVKLG
jgi:deferrochelatase/peroxidase EfeB